MSKKVISTENRPIKPMSLKDEFINENLRRICANNGGKIEFVNQKKRYANSHDVDELSKLFRQLDLADIKPAKSTLTSFGEHVCKAGGWIKYQQKISIMNKRKTIKKILKWGFGIIITAMITYILNKCDEESKKDVGNDTIQSPPPIEVQKPIANCEEKLNVKDSIVILKK